ncbi:NOP58 family protein [Candidatus Woesearchaeota archaeon]|nr:NOP58 family protein [Candidatus Woesearchaeota archaeon]
MEELSKLRVRLLEDTRKKVQDSVRWDTLVIQAISGIEELDKMINQISSRAREWYAWYNPETVDRVRDNEKFIELITTKDKKDLLKEINAKNSIGRELNKEDIEAIMVLAKNARILVETRQKETSYLEKILTTNCPNMHKILGTTLCAKLLRHLGGLEKVSKTPATVIQIIGAEKSLFKHMSGKAKSPKYGLIHAHPLIAKVNKKNKGKMARAIADKVAIAARIDFFKGKPIDYRKELEEKANKLI